MQALDRLLDLVCRELGATRAWIEYGSAPPPDALSAPVRDGWRLCAALEAPTAEARTQLEEFAASFDRVLLEATDAAPAPLIPSEIEATLQHTLDVLVERAGAHAAWVFDERSPIVWGASTEGAWLREVGHARTIGEALGEHAPDVVMRWAAGQQVPAPPPALVPHLPTLAKAAEAISPEHLVVTWAAVAEASSQGSAWSWDRAPLHVMVRPIAAIYRLLVLFDGEFSPLHAETTLTRALPVIERLVTDRPPIDPTPQGASVHVFPGPSRG